MRTQKMTVRNSMKIRVVNDIDKVSSVREALRLNQGYCPCKIIRDADSKCMCKEFREQDTTGICHCGLYEKVEEL